MYFPHWSNKVSEFTLCTSSTKVALRNQSTYALCCCGIFLSGEEGGSSFWFGSGSFLMSVMDRVACCPWEPHNALCIALWVTAEPGQLEKKWLWLWAEQVSDRYLWGLGLSWADGRNSSAIAHINHFLFLSLQVLLWRFCPIVALGMKLIFNK